MNDLISIIIPVYNRVNVLEECIRSLQVQSWQSFEIILIDDGSSDGTLPLCRTLAKEDDRISVLSMDHRGVSAARNRGLEAARGSFLFFIDSDDVIHPQLLEALVSGMKDTGAQLAGTDVVPLPEKSWQRAGELIGQDAGPGKTVLHDHEATLRALFLTSSPLKCIGGVMVRRDLVGQTRFRTDLFIGEDFFFIYENLIKGASALFLQQSWYYCRLHACNTSWDWSYDGFWTRFYRRELVWEREEALGRTAYADCQKREAFGIFLNCLGRNPPDSQDCRKMCSALQARRDVLLPALPPLDRLRFHLYVHLPAALHAMLRLKKLLRKLGLLK